jgi:hypothetical protein
VGGGVVSDLIKNNGCVVWNRLNHLEELTMKNFHATAKPNHIVMFVIAAFGVGFATAGFAQNSVALGGAQEIIVEDTTTQSSNNLGSVQVFTWGNVPGSPIVAEYNNTGDAARSTVYAFSKLAGYWDMISKNVGVHGHIPGTGSGGWGVVGSYGGFVDADNIGIDSPDVWGALGGEGYAVYANGEQFSTTGTLWVTSDERLKQNIEDIPNALSLIHGLRPSHYEYREEFRAVGVAVPVAGQYGFIAQELETVLPSLVREVELPFSVPPLEPVAMQETVQNAQDSAFEKTQQSEDPMRYKAIQILGLIPLLTKAVQELDAKVDIQVAQVTRENELLKARLANLESRSERRFADLEARNERLATLVATMTLQPQAGPLSVAAVAEDLSILPDR